MSLSVDTDRQTGTDYSVADVVAVMGRVRQAIEQVIEGKREAVDLAMPLRL